MESSQNREPTIVPSSNPPPVAAATPMDFLNGIMNQPSPTKTGELIPIAKVDTTPHMDITNRATLVDPMKDILAGIEAKKAQEAEERNRVQTDDIQIEEASLEDSKVEEEDAIAGDVSDEDILDETKDPKVESFKLVRKKANEYKAQVETITNELHTLKDKLEEYQSGEIVPEVLNKYEDKIQKLEKYEKIHNLKGSDAYRAKVIEPLNTLGSRLSDMGKDYDVPDSVLLKAINTPNRRERDEILEDHFSITGALEAKQIINEMVSLRSQAAEMEKEPEKLLQSITAEYDQIQESKRQEKIQSITKNSRDGWVKAHQNIVSKKLAAELIPTDDPEFNEKVVTPLLNQARLEYTKVIKELARLGITDLPESLALSLAQTFQLAHATPVAMDSRQKAVDRVDALEANTRRVQNFVRPKVGSAQVANGGNPPAPPIGGTKESLYQTAEELMDIGRQIAKQRGR